MSRRKLLCALTLVLVALYSASVFVVGLQAQQPSSAKGTASRNSHPGQRTFTATCAGCHGLDGRGGERGPNITGNTKLQRLTDAELSHIVSNGVPGAGMPAFRSLGVSEVHAVVGYLRVLQGKDNVQAFPGNPVQGNAVFFGRAECSSCHMVQGQGGFLGSDLSTYGSTRSAQEILDVIIQPAKNAAPSHNTVIAVTRDGHRVSGLVRNEDNFSVQILTAEGAFYFFVKSDLQSLEYQAHPVMPSDYKERLSASELDDLASYLMSVGRKAKPEPVVREED